MEKRDQNHPHLTEHDKEVLGKIIEQAKIPDSEIAEGMGISPQAVFKIRGKLEQLGIIKGYVPIIDFKKIGINIIVVLIIRMTAKAWESFTDDQISERIRKAPYVIGAYRVADEQASHIFLLGFKDTYQKESFLAQVQTKFAQSIHITSVYTFSVDKIITWNPLRLLYQLIDGKEFTAHDLFFDVNKR